MVSIGQMNRLRVAKYVEFGLYLDAQELGEILLPKRYIPSHGSEIGDWLEVFIYLDSEDDLIATTETPYATVGECVHLSVSEVNPVGAFMDWGLPKELLVPFQEQRVPMEAGKAYTVFIYLDNSNRIAASSKLNRFLAEESDDYKPGQPVNLLACSRSDLGYTAIINGTHLGLIHNSDLLQPIVVGRKYKGFIKDVREDKKINLTLQQHDQKSRDDLSEKIINHLISEGGSSTVTDKSRPEIIFHQFKVSKGNYKKALGKLYKDKRIKIEKDLITLIDN